MEVKMRLTLRVLGIVLAMQTFAGFGFAATSMEKSLSTLQEQKASHEDACARASKRLLEAFSDTRKQVEKSTSVLPESRLGVIASLREEEATFQTFGYLPFSTLMRPATARYLREFNTSARKLARAYDRVIRLVTKKHGLEQAQRLIDEKSAIAKPIAKWHCRLSYPRQHETFTWVLYTDFTVNPDNDGKDAYPKAWALNTDAVMIINVCPGCPRGGFRDTCRIRWDGQQIEARNQRGGVYVGHRVN